MKTSLVLYRMRAAIQHALRAWNTGGEGIHSPYLFEWVRMILYDTHSYYAWAEIEKIREQMLQSSHIITFQDWGSGATIRGEKRSMQVKDIAKHSLSSKQNARILFRLVTWLTHQQIEKDPTQGLTIVELGTSLGITTAYLAAPDKRNRIITFEGCHPVAELARENWRQLGLKNIECCEGDINNTLFIHACARVDVAFIDANHTPDATCRYFDWCKQRVDKKSVVVLDDIHYSPQMQQAWEQIQQDPMVTTTMDLGQIGMVFFDPCYLKKSYRLRI